jgi:hypothetical protein
MSKYIGDNFSLTCWFRKIDKLVFSPGTLGSDSRGYLVLTRDLMYYGLMLLLNIAS